MLLVAYRSILVVNLLISTIFTFGEAKTHYFGLFPWAYYVHLVLLVLFNGVLIYNAKRNRILTSRFLFALVYSLVCFISLEIILHGDAVASLTTQENHQIYWFIAEVLLCAILIKNDFRLQISFERRLTSGEAPLKKKIKR